MKKFIITDSSKLNRQDKTASAYSGWSFSIITCTFDKASVLGIDHFVKTYYTYEYDKVVFETNPQEPENYVWNVHGINLISRQINGGMFCCMYNGHADITVMVDENGKLAEKYYYYKGSN